MRRGVFTVAVAAVLSIAGCSGESITGFDQLVYNATFVGPATFQGFAPNPVGLSQASRATLAMTLSQLGRDFTGRFTVADSTGQALYAGSVAGRVTNTGGDFTFVIPATCAGALYGSFTVSNGELTGSAAGRDCNATAPGNNVHITFTNLVRQ